MCAIFGLLDYKGNLTAVQWLRIIKAVGTAAEVRGTDATGIAFFQRDKLCIQKAAKPAHKMKYRIPSGVQVIMGHTRLTTQGNASRNQNNHPFPGKAGNTEFALAHNGVLHNDFELRQQNALPATSIETDSYIAVQLIEQQQEVTFNSLRRMARLLKVLSRSRCWTRTTTCTSSKAITRWRSTIIRSWACTSTHPQKESCGPR